MEDLPRKANNGVKHVIIAQHRRDEYGAYVPVCVLGFHPGLPLDSDLCLQRKCYHFRKVYMKDNTIIKLRTDDDTPKCNSLEFII